MSVLIRRPTLAAALAAALLWMVAFVCYIAPGVAARTTTAEYALFLATCAVLGFLLSLLVFAALRSALRRRGWRRMARGVGGVAAALLTHALADTACFMAIMGPPVAFPSHAPVSFEAQLLLANVLLLAPVHVTYAIAVVLGFSIRALGERERRLAAALAAAQDAQVAALRFQINPHFLFNALNAVSALVTSGRNAEADTVVSRLAAFFRATVERPPTALVTLEEEFDVAGSYLDIEATRFGERLLVDMELPRRLATALVPHFLLQPLVENAIKHAVSRSKRPVTIRVSAAELEKRLVLEVRDDGTAASSSPGAGVGLQNVAARVAAVYGEEGCFETSRRDDGFLARIVIPLSFAEPAHRAA